MPVDRGFPHRHGCQPCARSAILWPPEPFLARWEPPNRLAGRAGRAGKTQRPETRPHIRALPARLPRAGRCRRAPAARQQIRPQSRWTIFIAIQQHEDCTGWSHFTCHEIDSSFQLTLFEQLTPGYADRMRNAHRQGGIELSGQAPDEDRNCLDFAVALDDASDSDLHDEPTPRKAEAGAKLRLQGHRGRAQADWYVIARQRYRGGHGAQNGRQHPGDL